MPVFYKSDQFYKTLTWVCNCEISEYQGQRKGPKNFQKKNNQGTHRGKDIIIAPEFLIAFLEARR